MENYNLGPDEVVLYKGNVTLKEMKGETELILTNHNLVFINKYKRLFSKAEITVIDYPTTSIKMYEGIPQIKTKGDIVEVYLVEGEKEIRFYSKSEQHKFTSVANKLLTGMTTAQRNAKKVKDAIGLVDDTLGINSVQATGTVIKNGVVGNLTGVIGKIGKSIFNKK